MKACRYLMIVISLVAFPALILASAWPAVTASGPSRSSEAVSPGVSIYLPLVARQYPLPAVTPTVPPTFTPPQTPEPTPDIRHWTGTTNLGHPMSFDVSADGTQWSDFTLRTSGRVGPCSVTITTTLSGPGAITDNHFGSGTATYSFAGQFLSPTTANGTYAYSNYYIYGCGYFTQNGTWAASRP